MATNDLKAFKLIEKIALYQTKWKCKIHVVPQLLELRLKENDDDYHDDYLWENEGTKP